MINLDFSRCRKVWVPDESKWNPPPPHVEAGVRFIVEQPFCMNADDMGGMKTAQAIISAQFLHDAGLIDRAIVVATAAIRSKVWFDRDLGQLNEQVFEDKYNIVSEYHSGIRQWTHGDNTLKPLRWIVTNYEFIRSKKNLEELLLYCGSRTMLILDESSAVRGYDSAQTEACMLLRWRANAKGRPILGSANCGRILEMNGTPVAESPMDLFSQGNLLHPSILDCKYVTHYRGRYAIQGVVTRGNGTEMLNPRTGKPLLVVEGWKNEGIIDLQQRFAPYVIRREAKELGIDFALPPVGYEVSLTSTTWKYYKEMRDNMVVWLESGVATASQAGVKAMRLAQITSGFLGGIEDANIGDEEPEEGLLDSLDLPYEPIDFNGLGVNDAIDKIQKVIGPPPSFQEIGREKLDFTLQLHADLLKHDPNLKFLAWCRFVPELARYLREERLTFPSIPVGAACGQKIFEGNHTQRSEREYALKLLHPKSAPEGPATVGATQGTGSMGLNFTACRTVLDMSYDQSPWKKKQGDARVNRPGQTGPVSFFYLVAVGPKGQKTIDHHTMLMRLGKMSVNDLTVSGWVKILKEE